MLSLSWGCDGLGFSLHVFTEAHFRVCFTLLFLLGAFEVHMIAHSGGGKPVAMGIEYIVGPLLRGPFRMRWRRRKGVALRIASRKGMRSGILAAAALLAALAACGSCPGTALADDGGADGADTGKTAVVGDAGGSADGAPADPVEGSDDAGIVDSGGIGDASAEGNGDGVSDGAIDGGDAVEDGGQDVPDDGESADGDSAG